MQTPELIKNVTDSDCPTNLKKKSVEEIRIKLNLLDKLLKGATTLFREVDDEHTSREWCEIFLPSSIMVDLEELNFAEQIIDKYGK